LFFILRGIPASHVQGGKMRAERFTDAGLLTHHGAEGSRGRELGLTTRSQPMEKAFQGRGEPAWKDVDGNPESIGIL